MLARRGIRSVNDDCVVQLCNDCRSSLSKNKIPRYSLRNGLYRGSLPEQLQDLTWVEEMCCAIYRTTAHVTRLFQDGVKVHGNTCAHDTNVISTVEVLPRTPADVLGHLTVVFVGAGVVQPHVLKNMFQVRKEKVWQTLMWLKEHNAVYRNLVFSREHMELYNSPDELLPGIDEAII
ncbi:hypothetical protein SISSUDRAFT_990986, partial [Sistotremastrum suecicum HHB10207 ss-3]